jgi:hypothetical protein
MSNRKVSTDALETLGTIIGDGEKRDAIHLAVDPVEALERLHPGEEVELQSGRAVRSKKGKGLGIVDPFLTVPVQPGQRFWLVLHPRTVTSLRHVWSHPAFPDTADAPLPHRDAVELIRRTADEAGLTYDEMLAAAKSHAATGEYLCQGGRWEGMSVDDDFWDAYETVTGEKVDENDRGGIFTCSC